MMNKPIAMVTRLESEAENEWARLINALLPGETLLSFRQMTPAQKAEAEIAIVANPDPREVAELPALRWIHSLWAGVEKLVDQLGTSAPPIVRLVDPEMSRVMSEAVLAWTYYLQRDMPFYRKQQNLRQWHPQAYRHPASMTVGILGLGTLGLASARKLAAAGFQVRGWSRSPDSGAGFDCVNGDGGLASILTTSDIIVSLLPLTVQTRGLLNAERLSHMKTGAGLINFSRGPIIVTDDLIAMLDKGHLSHAVLDVFDVEPLPQTSALWDHPSVTVLPHISGPTDHDSAARIVAANIQRFRATGQIPATVDMSRGY